MKHVYELNINLVFKNLNIFMCYLNMLRGLTNYTNCKMGRKRER